MTDREEFIKFFEKFNIPYHTKEHDPKTYYDDIKENEIVITADDGDKLNGIEGYLHFYCDIRFDENDKFLKIGIWE